MTYAQAKAILIKKELIPDNSDPVVASVSAAVHLLLTRASLKTYKEPLQAIAAILDHITFDHIHTSMQPALDHLENVAMDLNQEELALYSQLHDFEDQYKTSRELLTQQEALLGKFGDMATQLQSHLTTLKAAPTPSYSVALLSASNLSPNSSPISDPYFVQQLITRQCQVLIDADEAFTGSVSIEDLTSWMHDFLKAEDSNRPAEAGLESIQKLCNGGLILRFSNKETVDWLHSEGVHARLLAIFGGCATIKARGHMLVVPFIPLTFEPDREADLHFVEESNNLPPVSIMKAKWIKPARRCTLTQMTAFAFLTVLSLDIGNRLIRDGLLICHACVHPQKAKKEPIRCLCCQNLGHFMADCCKTDYRCGQCGDAHHTDSCQVTDRVKCASCGSPKHNTFTCDCPAYLERCTQLDKRFPENQLHFFPTEEVWTHHSDPRLSAPRTRPQPPVQIQSRGRGPTRRSMATNANTVPIGQNGQRPAATSSLARGTCMPEGGHITVAGQPGSSRSLAPTQRGKGKGKAPASDTPSDAPTQRTMSRGPSHQTTLDRTFSRPPRQF
ncbi:hypothetical protein EWM64_g1540 [Hericium alpestre]|uniref:CCHC-type domain-containing protein n=1 Tax=Hericium alpestre TaxID=135208 RepID=A0A4Z0A6V6_9AGAM|nr:hypothetical protein EWM64_g1540 [Hericium alpestre]